ncbi:hypothetical protein ACN47E_005141 [Coniothyrium glycines]
MCPSGRLCTSPNKAVRRGYLGVLRDKQWYQNRRDECKVRTILTKRRQRIVEWQNSISNISVSHQSRSTETSVEELVEMQVQNRAGEGISSELDPNRTPEPI